MLCLWTFQIIKKDNTMLMDIPDNKKENDMFMNIPNN